MDGGSVWRPGSRRWEICHTPLMGLTEQSNHGNRCSRLIDQYVVLVSSTYTAEIPITAVWIRTFPHCCARRVRHYWTDVRGMSDV